jgi:acyl dehydratase
VLLIEPEALLDLGGTDLGTSPWFEIDQGRIDKFADATEDHQWIHVDATRAAEGQFGATIAHGYLVLSLIPALLHELLRFSPLKQALNYGVEKLRFTLPVLVGSRIRVAAQLVSAERRGDLYVYRVRCEVEVQGEARPAIVAELLFGVM